VHDFCPAHVRSLRTDTRGLGGGSHELLLVGGTTRCLGLADYTASLVAPVFAGITPVLAPVFAVIAAVFAPLLTVVTPLFATFHPRGLSLGP
jgi:hypothetical protein